MAEHLERVSAVRRALSSLWRMEMDLKGGSVWMGLESGAGGGKTRASSANIF